MTKLMTGEPAPATAKLFYETLFDIGMLDYKAGVSAPTSVEDTMAYLKDKLFVETKSAAMAYEAGYMAAKDAADAIARTKARTMAFIVKG